MTIKAALLCFAFPEGSHVLSVRFFPFSETTPTAKILRGGAARAAAAHLVGGFRPHRRPIEAFFGGRAAWPTASGVIVRPGRAPAALGVGVDRGQPRHFWRCSSSRWPGHLTLEGRPSSWRSTLRPSELACGQDRGAGGRSAPLLLTAFCGGRACRSVWFWRLSLKTQ